MLIILTWKVKKEWPEIKALVLVSIMEHTTNSQIAKLHSAYNAPVLVHGYSSNPRYCLNFGL
jgi:hypothetical protein